MNRLLSTALLIFIVMQHFQIAAFAGFPVTVGLFSFLIILALLSGRTVDARKFILSILALTYSIVVALSTSDVSVGTFFSTFALLSFSLVAFTIQVSSEGWLLSRSFDRVCRFTLLLVSTLAVLQAVTGSRGSSEFFNPWGSRQYLYQYNPLFQFNPVPRAAGFYLEPSYCAFVIGTVFVLLCLARSRLNYLDTALAVAGMAATRSATGLVLLTIVLVLIAIRQRSWLVLGCSVAVIAFLGNYISGRISSISSTGSSGNYRYAAPLEVLNYVLSQRPLGAPLGSIDSVIKTFDLQNGNTRGGSIDNGFYLIVYYFGWFGVLACCLAVLLAFRLAFKNWNSGLTFLGPVWLIGSLLFSGGIFLPEFVGMSWLIAVRTRAFQHYRRGASKHDVAKHCDDHFQRLRWPRPQPPFSDSSAR
jgi:putative colanic acid polymerase